MRIIDLLKKNGIALNVKAESKSEAIDKLVALHEKCGNLNDSAAFKEGILKRESQGTTAVGMGIAIPHAKSAAVKAPALTAIAVPDGVNYDAADGQDCTLIFMIAATLDGDVHLEVLARLMQLLMDEEFTDKLKAAKSADEFLRIIDEKEKDKFPDEACEKNNSSKTGYRVLAVTACPTGIAHTYMAAEALVKAGEKMGITVKAESNGSGGAKNVLTREEIENCDGIIIAADKSVETARFDGKPVYSTKVSDGINKPEELINKIINGEAPVYHSGKKASSDSADSGNEGVGRQLYKHLMNGVSHMLPFVVAGGIFIAIAFLIDTACGNAGSADFGTVNPVAAWFKIIGGYAFDFMLPVLAGFVAMSIADRPGLLVGFVGGILASKGATFADPSAASTVPSGFLGALLAGFAAGYLMLLLEKLCDKLPNALEGIKPVLIYPLAGLGIVGVMMCAVNPIMGVINTALNNGLVWLSDNNLGILLGCILAAMMSIDMGGPFNKAAYVFGTGMLTEAVTMSDPNVAYQIMASVMIGGMVPPLAIALSTTFFKNRWTKDERKNGVVNYVMGLSFVTEGAIPYAASYPLKVIPACAIGSAIAGGLSWVFGCTLMAPHGGIFVVATIGNPLMYLLALAVGSVVGMLLLALFKKPIKSND
ncbi:MAG: fructose-specific PTS transporter subunit EIIC [Clostridiales bacterium]|nr:fructose-specific PTS transporter subunit EIIC [Clostridiales bacterium]